MSLEINLINFIYGLSGIHWLIDGLSIISARFIPHILIISAVIFILHLKFWKDAYLYIFLSLSSIFIGWGIISQALKFIFKRQAPFEVLDNIQNLVPANTSTFPSDHITILSLLGVSIFIFNKKWGSIFLAITIIVALSRIITGVSWPSDIIISLLIGVIVPLALKPFIIYEKK
ncbi:MAG: hypothetical protein COV57_03495 [Candidatus Liptonbacteria bacterium CG11_big_fil_rev_8_21_14_0_20_35_14]|uniref:Phosphatidic acid phosphatase type 2/haloperoxidase domain-containing protein n=1 Tax=Candidatus Liptonbacteria bacterium CG11_big_fil_rev_8_21_14_0_20_35_14 TaxID=1974634 RepID=A0A2H0N6T6_9BACT|nr:MAG: hypothetical protein COV57_03495 [Candidatus Liptonbacteria bacterium CG11_big_fil_rev_8_21_14_0_20_35_14]